MTENIYLVHHGVKGMKWGVRRTPEQLGQPAPSRRELRKQYRTDMKSARRARGDAYYNAGDKYDTGQEKAYSKYKSLDSAGYKKEVKKLSNQYDSDIASAKNTFNTAKAAAKENYKKSVAAAKAKDAANYSDYKKAAQSYKKHAAMGEKVVANAMGKPTAYYARRAQGMSRGRATADVFMKGNMGALKAYGVKLSIPRVYAS